MDAAGNAYVVGWTQGDMDLGGGHVIDGSPSRYDTGFLVSLSRAGVYRWSVDFNPYLGRGVRVSGVAVDHSGNVYIAAPYSGSVAFGTADLTSGSLLVASFTSSGMLRWYHGFSPERLAGGEGIGLVVDAADNIYVAGIYSGAANFQGAEPQTATGENDLFLLSLNSAGVYRWAVRAGRDEVTGPVSLAVDPSGNTYLSARVARSLSDRSNILNSFSALGVARWNRVFDHAGEEDEGGVAADSSGNVFLVGTFVGSASYGGETFTTSPGFQQSFAVSLTSAGVHRWSQQFGVRLITAPALDTAGNFYTVFDTPFTDFGGGAVRGSSVIVSLNNMGVYRWSLSSPDIDPGSDYLTYANTIVTGGDGSLVMAGFRGMGTAVWVRVYRGG